MIADWLEAYANGQNLVIWLSSTVLSDPRPVYDEEKRSWTVSVERIIRSSDGGKTYESCKSNGDYLPINCSH